jgi:hypothetical protein
MTELPPAGASGKRNVTNRFEAVRCQACGRSVKRQARQQRFCSDRCRKYAERNAPCQINARTALKNLSGHQDSGRVRVPLFLSKKISGLQGRTSGSSIPLNVLGGSYRWPNAVSVDRGLLRKIVRAEIGEAGTGADVLKAKATRQLAEHLLKHESLRSRRKRNGCATSKHGWQAKRQ